MFFQASVDVFLANSNLVFLFWGSPMVYILWWTVCIYSGEVVSWLLTSTQYAYLLESVLDLAILLSLWWVCFNVSAKWWLASLIVTALWTHIQRWQEQIPNVNTTLETNSRPFICSLKNSRQCINQWKSTLKAHLECFISSPLWWCTEYCMNIDMQYLYNMNTTKNVLQS